MDVILLGEIEDKLTALNSSLSNNFTGVNNNITTVNNNVTSVKTVVDNIYSKVDTEVSAILTNTNTNNTGSLTGTLSQKLSTIANNLVGGVNNTGGLYNSGTVHAKLATLILNQCTEFVAGDNIVKYEPISTETTWAIGDGGTRYSNSNLGFSHFRTHNTGAFAMNKIKFVANRTGSVKITVNAKVESYYYEYGVAVTDKDFSSAEKSLATMYWGINTDNVYNTKTATFPVSAGKTYYIHVGYVGDSDFSTSNKVYVKSIKVSYNIVTNTTLL